MNTVKYLQSINFSHLTLNEKLEIKAKGRHTPVLAILQKVLVRARIIHAGLTPICIKNVNGFVDVTSKNALFSFPCLVFGGDLSWTKNGLCIKC